MSVPLGVYTRYDRLGASSRLRYYGYRAAFEAAGFAPEFYPFFSDAYLTRLYAGRGKSRLLAAAALTPQEKDMLRQRGLWPKQPREDV